MCALACPYGENYPSSSDFRWIAAPNSPDLAGVGRGGSLSIPGCYSCRLNGRRGERRGRLPGAAAAPEAPCLPPAAEPAAPERARLSAPARGQSPARAGVSGARCRLPARCSHPSSLAPAVPARLCHWIGVPRCLQRGLPAVKGSTEHHGRCPLAARCSPAARGAGCAGAGAALLL